jgi:hypothetical protein
VVFEDDRCCIYKDQVLLFKSLPNSHTNNLDVATVPGTFAPKDVPSLPTSIQYSATPCLTAYVSALRALATTEVWRARLGHLGLDNMELLIQKQMVLGFPITQSQIQETNKDIDRFCELCVMANAKRTPSPSNRNPPTTRILELLRTDLACP